MFRLPRHGDRAAAAIDEDDRPAGGVQSLEQGALDGGQFDAGAITAFEAIVVHPHFLALELRTDAADIDDCVGGTRGFHGSEEFRRMVVDGLARVQGQRAALRVHHFDAGTGGGLDALQDRDGV